MENEKDILQLHFRETQKDNINLKQQNDILLSDHQRLGNFLNQHQQTVYIY